jgi:hypothetical protein
MSSLTVSAGLATYTGFRAAPQVRAMPIFRRRDRLREARSRLFRV